MKKYLHHADEIRLCLELILFCTALNHSKYISNITYIDEKHNVLY